jgi:hypothetical protein
MRLLLIEPTNAFFSAEALPLQPAHLKQRLYLQTIPINAILVKTAAAVRVINRLCC